MKTNYEIPIYDIYFKTYHDLVNNCNYKEIINTKEFKRLNNISFMGAIDYTSNKHVTFSQRTRAAHSIDVAVLAKYICNKRGYSLDLTNNIVIAALLHDIGHFPLSHSVEHTLKEKFGYGHHDLGESILRGEVSHKNLNKILTNKYDLDFIINLLNKNANDVDGGDLFSSFFNIDTIDGIFRASKYIKNPPYFDRFKVADASFGFLENNIEQLDYFWKVKNIVYSNLIQNSHGLISDSLGALIIQDELFNNRGHFSEEDIFKSESSWHQKYKCIFKIFKKFKEKEYDSTVFQKMRFSKLGCNRKLYIVDSSKKDIKKRYIFKKEYKNFNVDSYIYDIDSSEQMELGFD